MPIGNSIARSTPKGKYIPLWKYIHIKNGKSLILNKEYKISYLAALESATLQHVKKPRHAVVPVRLAGAYFAVSAAAVLKAGRISFGTTFILSSAFCTSGRISTYLVIMSFARA